jgi:hypothetical protein
MTNILHVTNYCLFSEIACVELVKLGVWQDFIKSSLVPPSVDFFLDVVTSEPVSSGDYPFGVQLEILIINLMASKFENTLILISQCTTHPSLLLYPSMTSEFYVFSLSQIEFAIPIVMGLPFKVISRNFG